MQDRTELHVILRPQAGEGQRVAIGAASARSAAMDIGKEHQIWASKACWLRTGDNAVDAVQPAGGPPEVDGDFPIPAGGVYTYTPTGSDDQYIAVIEDASVNGITGYLFIGRSEA